MLKTLCYSFISLIIIIITIGVVIKSNPQLVNGLGGCRRISIGPRDENYDKAFRNKCIVIVGGSNGIGQEMVNILANVNAQVITSGRTAERALKAIYEEKNKKAIIGAFGVDLSEESSVDMFGKNIITTVNSKCSNGKIDYLFLNAGMITTTPETSLARDGMDIVFKSNFVGNARLLKQLVDQHGVISRTTRIVVTSSIAHIGGNIEHLKNPIYNSPSKDEDERWVRYWDSKLAITSLQQELAQKHQLNFVSCTCGLVKTAITHSPLARQSGNTSEWANDKKFLDYLDQLILNQKEGGQYVLDAALAKDIKPDEFSYPYVMPTTGLGLYNSFSSHAVRFYMSFIFEWLQRLTARDGFLFICPSTRDAKLQETRDAVMKFWR
jgi:NAD(P)-dependent dehydrogenase (short-subunit alcohol dehydrogenase family)